MLQSVTESVGVFTEGTHKSPHSEALNLREARPPAPVVPDNCTHSSPHIARCDPWLSLSSTNQSTVIPGVPSHKHDWRRHTQGFVGGREPTGVSRIVVSR